jgi:hypothetical protein
MLCDQRSSERGDKSDTFMATSGLSTSRYTLDTRVRVTLAYKLAYNVHLQISSLMLHGRQPYNQHYQPGIEIFSALQVPMTQSAPPASFIS